MKQVHQLDNTKFKNELSLKRVFENTSSSKFDYSIEENLSIINFSTDSKFVKIIGDFKVKTNSENVLLKIVVYFPEKQYAIEFIKQTAEISIEFLYEILNTKEYFNLVIFDRHGDVLSSTTYVFNNKNIIPYPLREKDISDLYSECNIQFKDNIIIFESKFKNEIDLNIKHTWQNLGQNYVLNPEKVTDNPPVFITSMEREKMCSGIWMLIATDQEDKLISQSILSI